MRRRNNDGIRELLECLFELHVERACAKHPIGERDAQRTVGELPILHAIAAHFAYREAGLRREVERVDARALDVERKRVRHQQPRFLESHCRPVGNVHEWLDAFEPGGQFDGPPVEPIRRQRAAAGVDLPQAGRGIDFHERVIGGKGE